MADPTPRERVLAFWPEAKAAEPIMPEQLAQFWMDNFAPHDACCLCGNKGFIDTRGQVFTAAGADVGARVPCLCPNGRALADAVAL